MIDLKDLEHKPEKHIINEMQLILSEKRTALSILRTGITVMLLPLSTMTVLLATSKYYNIMAALSLAIPLGLLCLGLFALGFYLIYRAMSRIKKYDYAANLLLQKSEYLSNLLDTE